MLKRSDEMFMQIALSEAELALKDGNLPIGAVIVHRNEVISKGHNQVWTRKTDLAHAELEAISLIQGYLYNHRNECEIYTTLEPCIMCLGAIIIFKFKRLIIGSQDHAVGGLSLVQGSGYYRERMPVTITGICNLQSADLIAKYVTQTGRSLHLLQCSK